MQHCTSVSDLVLAFGDFNLAHFFVTLFKRLLHTTFGLSILAFDLNFDCRHHSRVRVPERIVLEPDWLSYSDTFTAPNHPKLCPANHRGTDPQTGKNYAIMGLSNKTSFVDITDPANPIHLGDLPGHSHGILWRDIKVYRNHAFIVSEAMMHGMQVFDLTQLRGMDGTNGPMIL